MPTCPENYSYNPTTSTCEADAGGTDVDPGQPSFGSGEGDFNPSDYGGLEELFGDLDIDEDQWGYFEDYDPWKEELAADRYGLAEDEYGLAGEQHAQSMLQAGQQFGRTLTGAQAKTGQSLGQAYEQARASGGGGFGGTRKSVASLGSRAMEGYKQARTGAEQKREGQEFAAGQAYSQAGIGLEQAGLDMTKAVRGSQDAYKQQVLQLINMISQGS